MYSQLTEQCSLFLVNPAIVDEFKQLANRYDEKNAPIDARCMRTVDSSSIHLNIWLNGEAARHAHVFKVEHTLYYTIDYAILQYLAEHLLYQKFNENANEFERFVFSQQLTKHILRWFWPYIMRMQWQQMNTQKKPYYLFYEDIEQPRAHPFIQQQAVMTKQFMQTFQPACCMEKAIAESAHYAKQYVYNENKLG